MARKVGEGGGIGFYVLGFLSAPVLLVAAVTVYFNFGRPPVAVADRHFPFEGSVLRHPVNKRIDHVLTGPPFGSGEDVFEAGAHVYMTQCASCHGTPGRDSAFAKNMYPMAPQLWRKGGPDHVFGVTEIETGRSYWKIANGIRLSGMPSYSKILTETEMWQVTLLLKHASDQLPKPVMAILKQ
jgi:thiosulfate dehydrogenase